MGIEFLAYFSIRQKNVVNVGKYLCGIPLLYKYTVFCSAYKLKWDKIYSPGSRTELEGVTNQAAKRSKFMSVGSARFVQKKS